MKSGFIAIVGRPNVGKSTLLNAILGEKISIVSSKPQTTRNRIRGIYNDEDAQLVFLDTPGIHRPRTKLGSYMTDSAMGTLGDVDAVVFMVDESPKAGPGDRYIMEALEKISVPKVLVINKTDLMDEEQYVSMVDTYRGTGIFDEIIGISAKEGRGVDVLLDYLKSIMEEGHRYYPEDMITDSPERFIVGEIIREKILMYMEQEVPHGIAVRIESFDENKTTKGEEKIDISAVIYCERKSHKSMIIGKQGRKLKGIGKAAREDMEALFGCKVFLETWVKVKENWRDSDIALSDLGYKKEEF